MNGVCNVCGRFGPIKRGLCSTHYKAYLKNRSEEERRRPTTAERFWSKVDKQGPDECWAWTGSRRASGHGIFCVTRTNKVPAGSYALYLCDGIERPDELHVLHHCDNPPCVNPQHLYYGTPADNARDRVSRGREPRGEQRPNTRLTSDAVIVMRERFAAGEYLEDVALEFSVSTGLLSKIVNGIEWRHVGGPRTNRKDQRGTTKRSDIRVGSVTDRVWRFFRDNADKSYRAADVQYNLKRNDEGEIPIAQVRNALGYLTNRTRLNRLSEGVYQLREQVSVGRSFATTERAADQIHAGGGP